MDIPSTEYVEEIIAEEEPVSINPMQYLRLVWNIFEVYGWYMIGLAIVLALIYKKLEPYLDDYHKKKAEYEYAQKYHKDPDMAAERMARQAEAIRRKQEEYNKAAEEYQKKQEEKEHKKQEDKLAKLQGKSGGQKLGGSAYNPLMGDTTNRTFRSSRKPPCAGGGCG